MKTTDKNNQIIIQSEISESLANAIRRYINRVPVLAVGEVEISRNDSPLYDETVAHRIGLIPLKSDKAVIGKTTSTLTLDSKKEGPVYSGEMIGDVKVVYDKIPITNLTKGQEIKIVATVIAGKGEDHAKFSPGLMFYRNLVDIKLEKDCPKEAADICPKGILKESNGKISVVDVNKCDNCEACIDFCQKKGKKNAITISPKEELIITVESFGQMPAEDILKKAIDVLKKDLADVSKDISK